MKRQTVTSVLRVEVLLFFFVWFVYGLTINTKNLQDYSLAKVEAFVDYRRVSVEGLATWRPGDDSVRYKGHAYSDKQPGEGILAGIAYAHLRLLGLSFASDKFLAAALTTFFSGSLLMAIGVVFLYWLARDLDGGRSTIWPLGAALVWAFGTTAFAYAGLAQHDTMAPPLMVIGFYFLQRIRNARLSPTATRWFSVLAGFLLGFTLTTSMLQLYMVLVFGAYFLLLRRWKLIVPFTVGGILGFGPSILYNVICFGDPFLFPLLAHVKYAGYNYDAEVFVFFEWKNFTEKLWVYCVLVSRYLPVLWFGLVGLFFIRRRYDREAVFVITAILVLLAFVTNIRGLGTCAYGPRYLLPLMPLAALGVIGLHRIPSTTLRYLVGSALALVGLLSAKINLAGAIQGALYCNLAGYAYPEYIDKLMRGDVPPMPLFRYLLPLTIIVALLIVYRSIDALVRSLKTKTDLPELPL